MSGQSKSFGKQLLKHEANLSIGGRGSRRVRRSYVETDGGGPIRRADELMVE
jgi:hypothetical protein